MSRRSLIPLSRAWFDSGETQRIAEALAGRVAGDGPICSRVEQRLASLLGGSRVLLTTSGSHALELALLSLGVGPGQEVICPSFTFVSTANAILRVGARPVFADIEPVGFGLDPAEVEGKLTPRTSALLPVHYAGFTTQLDALLELEPDHVSLYILEVEGRTVLAHRQRHGTLALPADDLVADLYRETVDRLGARGLERYEISNFARPGRVSRHNRKYWDEAPFLGLGLSAHSFRGRRRWWNHDRYATYCRAVEEGRGGTVGERALSDLELAQEALFTGLRRTEGVDLAAFRRRHRIDPLLEWAEPLAEVGCAGLAEIVADRLRLTDHGMLLSNEVFRIFV